MIENNSLTFFIAVGIEFATNDRVDPSDIKAGILSIRDDDGACERMLDGLADSVKGMANITSA